MLINSVKDQFVTSICRCDWCLEPCSIEKFDLNIANLTKNHANYSLSFCGYTWASRFQVPLMPPIFAPVCDFGATAPDFALPGIDGRLWSRADCLGTRGLLVMFICNHCPYVQAINKKLVRDTAELIKLGIGCVAIMPNDTQAYPEDDLLHMQSVAKEQGYPFPYLIDETQQVARQFGAVCTPDFFGYNSSLELQYRGRLDAAGAKRDTDHETRELYLAMKAVAESGKGPLVQVPSMGCSVKWRVNE